MNREENVNPAGRFETSGNFAESAAIGAEIPSTQPQAELALDRLRGLQGSIPPRLAEVYT